MRQSRTPDLKKRSQDWMDLRILVTKNSETIAANNNVRFPLIDPGGTHTIHFCYPGVPDFALVHCVISYHLSPLICVIAITPIPKRRLPITYTSTNGPLGLIPRSGLIYLLSFWNGHALTQKKHKKAAKRWSQTGHSPVTKMTNGHGMGCSCCRATAKHCFRWRCYEVCEP